MVYQGNAEHWFFHHLPEYYQKDPHDMEILEEVDETDLEAESFAVFND